MNITQDELLQQLKNYYLSYTSTEATPIQSAADLGKLLATLSMVCDERLVERVKVAIAHIVEKTPKNFSDIENIFYDRTTSIRKFEILTKPITKLVENNPTRLRLLESSILLDTGTITHVKLVEYKDAWCVLALLVKLPQKKAIRGLSSIPIEDLVRLLEQLSVEADIRYVKASASLKRQIDEAM